MSLNLAGKPRTMFSKLPRPCAERKAGSVSDRVSDPRDFSSWMELHWLETEAEVLRKKHEERKEYLAYVEQRTEELKKNIVETEERYDSCETFINDRDSRVHDHKAQVQIRLVQENEEKIEKLRKEIAEMSERKQELLRQVERHSVYKDFMEKVLHQSQFRDVDELVGHLENLLRTRDKLLEKRNQVEEQTDQQKKTLQTLEDRHNLLLLQKNNELSQLQTELDQARSKSLSWERKWDHIQDTAAKKTVELCQIKMAALSLFELGGGVVGEEGVNITDTDTQLDQIKVYIKDLSDIIKWYQSSLSEKRAMDEKGRKANKKRVKAKIPAVPAAAVML